jgi:TatA/E family protein of Tat protein translocase
LELIIVIIIILILFGGWRLPKISRSIGRTIGYLKKGMAESNKEEVNTKEEGQKKERSEKKENQPN